MKTISFMISLNEDVEIKKSGPLAVCLFAMVLVFFSFLLYYPLVYKPFDSEDHFQYLAERIQRLDFFQGLQMFDYSFLRTHNCGYDTALFRPLFFMVQAVLYQISAHSYWLWNSISISLHFILIVILYKILAEKTSNFFGFLLTLLFSSAPSVSRGMVGNVHFIPYLAGLIMVFLCVEMTLSETFLKRNQAAKTACCVGLLAVSVFLFEFSMLVSFALYFYVRRKSCRMSPYAVYFLIPGGLYGIFYGIRMLTHWDKTLTTTLAPVTDYLKLEMLVPILSDIGQSWIFWTKLFGESQDHSSLLFKIAYAGAFLCFLSFINIRKLKNSYAEIVLRFTLFWGHSCMLSFFRHQTPSHHFYFWTILLIPAAVSMIDYRSQRISKRIIFSAFLLAFTVTCFYSSYRQNRVDLILWRRKMLGYDLIEKFVNSHKDETHFSFNFNEITPFLNPDIPLEYGCDEKTAGTVSYQFLGLIYPKFYRKNDAKYQIAWKNHNVGILE